MKAYTVTLRRTEDGREVSIERAASPQDEEELVNFMWTEGNWGCDCNRKIEFLGALGEPVVEEEIVCGDGAFELISIRYEYERP